MADVDYDATNVYVPVTSHDVIRILAAIAVSEKLHLEGTDVSNGMDLFSWDSQRYWHSQPPRNAFQDAQINQCCKASRQNMGFTT